MRVMPYINCTVEKDDSFVKFSVSTVDLQYDDQTAAGPLANCSYYTIGIGKSYHLGIIT